MIKMIIQFIINRADHVSKSMLFPICLFMVSSYITYALTTYTKPVCLTIKIDKIYQIKRLLRLSLKVGRGRFYLVWCTCIKTL
jgi:hypothetical protein